MSAALIAEFESYLLHSRYTDEQLALLAASDTGRGEISPVDAAREIRARTAIAKAKLELENKP